MMKSYNQSYSVPFYIIIESEPGTGADFLRREPQLIPHMGILVYVSTIDELDCVSASRFLKK